MTVDVYEIHPRKAVNFSSARTTKCFPSPRCASAIQIVRPLQSTVETEPQLQPALLRIISDDFRESEGMVSVLTFNTAWSRFRERNESFFQLERYRRQRRQMNED